MVMSGRCLNVMGWPPWPRGYERCFLITRSFHRGVWSSPALVKRETSQVLLAGEPGGFSRGSPVFAPPTD